MTLRFSGLDDKLYDNALAERFLVASATLHWDRLDHEYVSTAALQARGLMGETGPMTDALDKLIDFDGGSARPSAQTAAVAGAPGTPVTVTVTGVGGPAGGFATVAIVLAGAAAEACPEVIITPNMTPGNAASALSASIDKAHGAGITTFVSTNVVTVTAHAPVTAITSLTVKFYNNAAAGRSRKAKAAPAPEATEEAKDPPKPIERKPEADEPMKGK